MERSEKRLASDAASGLSTVEQAANSAHHAIDRLSDVARPVVVRSAENVHHLVDRISGTTSRAVERLEQTATRLIDAERRLVGASSHYVHENPFKSAGIAAGVALLVGFVVGLASSRNPTRRRNSGKNLESYPESSEMD